MGNCAPNGFTYGKASQSAWENVGIIVHSSLRTRRSTNWVIPPLSAKRLAFRADFSPSESAFHSVVQTVTDRGVELRNNTSHAKERLQRSVYLRHQRTTLDVLSVALSVGTSRGLFYLLKWRRGELNPCPTFMDISG